MAGENQNSKVTKLVKERPSNAALISKLNQENISRDPKETYGKLEATLPNLTNDIKNKLLNNENIISLFPDIELVIQIITSSVLAPNDMVNNCIVYNIPEINLPISLKDSIKKVISNHIDVNYKLESNLSKILRESLFVKGAYVEAIIPEAAVDEIINGIPSDGQISVENFNKTFKSSIKNNTLGIFKDSVTDVKISTEDFSETVITSLDKTKNVTFENFYFDISDNVGYIVENDLKQKTVPVTVKENLNKYHKRKFISTEAKKDEVIPDNELDKLFKLMNSEVPETTVLVKSVKNTYRKSIGKPLVMKLPVESVIPVHVINNPDKHLGYFIVLDDNGAPIKMDEMVIDHNDYTNFKAQESKFNLVTKANNNLTTMTKKDIKIENLEEVYNAVLDKAIKDKLSKSIYDDLADIRDSGDVYRVMFSRALKAKKTRLVYLPKELVSYYSFEHRDNGTGKSLLEKTQMLFSIRSIVLFSKIMSYIKNAIVVTKVTATLDDDDIDPNTTMEKIISESLKTRQTLLPIGLNKIDELTDWAHKVGFRYNFKHPSLPNMELDLSDENRSMAVPDSELEDEIKKILYMAFGLTPEIVESGYSSDFATTVKAKNLLFAKRVTQIQDMFTPQISDHVKMILENDMSLQEKIYKLIKASYKETKKALKTQLTDKNEDESDAILESILNKEDKVIEFIMDKIITEIYISIPSTEMTEAAAMKTAFDSYNSLLKDYIDDLISNDSMPEELVGALGGKLDLVKSAIKSTLIRKWMADNNYVPEFSEFITLNSEGKPVFDILDEHNAFIESLSTSVSEFLIKNKEIKKEHNAKWIEATTEEEEPSEPIENSDGGSTDNNEASQTNDEFGNTDTGDDLSGIGTTGDTDEFGDTGTGEETIGGTDEFGDTSGGDDLGNVGADENDIGKLDTGETTDETNKESDTKEDTTDVDNKTKTDDLLEPDDGEPTSFEEDDTGDLEMDKKLDTEIDKDIKQENETTEPKEEKPEDVKSDKTKSEEDKKDLENEDETEKGKVIEEDVPEEENDHTKKKIDLEKDKNKEKK